MNSSATPMPSDVPPTAVRSVNDYPLGEHPSDREPVNGAFALVEAILRHPRRIIYRLKIGDAGSYILPLLLTAMLLIAVYGLIVGSFSGGAQWFLAPFKISIGMLITAVICVPSLYIFAGLGGSTANLTQVASALGGLLTLMALLLIGFAPVAWLFSQSTESIAMMGFLHLIFLLVSMHFGIRFLMSAFHYFGIRSNAGLKVWAAIFVLVSLQMTTALRPLIGTAETPLLHEKKFFISHWFDSMNQPDKASPYRTTRE